MSLNRRRGSTMRRARRRWLLEKTGLLRLISD